MPLVLLATDKPTWCFANIARHGVVKHLASDFEFKTMVFTRIVNETCDILVNFWWGATLRTKANTKAKKVVTCVYDCMSWDIDEPSRAQFKLVLKNSDGLFVCNEEILKRITAGFGTYLPQVVALIEDGVDTELFRPAPMPRKFAGGWTGDSTRHTPGGPADLKGLSVIKEAQQIAKVPMNILDASTGGPWPLERMPLFYQGISFYVCASYMEGTPNPVLEALACGRPVISTEVGVVPKLIRDGVNGYIVGRDPKEIAAAMTRVATMDNQRFELMGQAARESVRGWDWRDKARAWRNALKEVHLTPQRPATFYVPSDGAREFAPVVAIESGPHTPHDPPTALLISDVPGWAFHRNMLDLEGQLAKRFAFSHWFVIDWMTNQYVPDMSKFDIVFCVYHRWAITNLIPWSRTVGSLRGRWFVPEPGKIGPPGPKEFELVNRYRAFHVVTRDNFQELRERCPNVVYLTNPVEMARFPKETEVDDRLVATWNGNAAHGEGGIGDVKGFYSHVRPACSTAGVPLNYAEYNTCRIAQEDMPEFYLKSNVALCASLYEGASNSVMEAMASGLALITTDCGNARELQESEIEHFGESGIIIVNRDPAAFVSALNELKGDMPRVKAMGQINRAEISAHWSWDAWRARYAEFLRKAI